MRVARMLQLTCPFIVPISLARSSNARDLQFCCRNTLLFLFKASTSWRTNHVERRIYVTCFWYITLETPALFAQGEYPFELSLFSGAAHGRLSSDFVSVAFFPTASYGRFEYSALVPRKVRRRH